MKRLERQGKIENINKDIGNNLLESSNFLVPTSKLQTPNSHLSHPTSHRSGITLIALVVTIVILLILAGITINLVLAEGGLFDRAKGAEKAQEMAVIKDYVGTATGELMIEIASPSNNYDRSESATDNLAMQIMKANFPNSMTLTNDTENPLKIENEKFSGSFIVKVNNTGNEYKVIISNGNVTVESIGEGESEESGGTDEDETVSVTGVSLNPTTANVTLGGTLTLTATVEPNNASDKTVTWESSDKSVATVSNGVVNALIAGNTTITVTTTDGRYTATCEITVEPSSLGKIVGKPASSTNQTVEDMYGNKVEVPANFKVVENGKSNVTYSYTGNTSEPSVQDGVVIEHEDDGNQFVWVPIGTINNKEDDTNGKTLTITLGRYCNFTKGSYVISQEASKIESEYDIPTPIETYFIEISSNFTGGTYSGTTYGAASTYGNKKATELGDWISSTIDNGGYYIARYEASYGENGKPLSQQSTGTPAQSGDYDVNTTIDFASKFNQGQLWNYINQSAAVTAARAMYPATTGSNYYSDLVNSYAWDTAIIFIQAYSEEKDYAYATSKYTDPSSPYQPANTGERGTTVKIGANTTDKVCNIYDMASNVVEWTTETSTNSDNPCVLRGGNFVITSRSTNMREYRSTSLTSYALAFRPLLYVSSATD